jgi:DNA mismatch repair protein MutS
MAGIPSDVVRRASEVLAELEARRDHLTPAAAVKAMASDTPQMSFFQFRGSFAGAHSEKLRKIDVNGLTHKSNT